MGGTKGVWPPMDVDRRYMAKRCYYDTLGVKRNASDNDLKASFRKLAKECHPDRHPGDQTAEQRFKELNEAYEALKDPQKRAAYDKFGHAAFDMGGRGHPGGGFGPDFASSMSDIFDDLFGEFMGGRRGRGARNGTRARCRSPLQHGDHPQRGLRRQGCRDSRPN